MTFGEEIAASVLLSAKVLDAKCLNSVCWENAQAWIHLINETDLFGDWTLV
jgi:hypothetical protein